MFTLESSKPTTVDSEDCNKVKAHDLKRPFVSMTEILKEEREKERKEIV